MPAVVVVNDALEGFGHRDVFAWHLTITIKAERLAKNGMPTKAESSVLDEIGDRIEEVLDRNTTEHGSANALFLARVTCDGQRELEYRIHDPELVNAALERCTKAFREREWSYEMHGDDEWADAQPFLELLASVRN